jgi:two-component system, chemotaxis family, chemotaxis protein CheY
VNNDRRTVLVVEDTSLCATMLEIALTQISDVSVRIVGSAREAKSVLNDGVHVCAVVTDVHLPDASGIDLVRWVRSRDSWATMPILVISGDSDPDTNKNVLKLGANAYFPKPFSPSEVRQKLEDLIDAAPTRPFH